MPVNHQGNPCKIITWWHVWRQQQNDYFKMHRGVGWNNFLTVSSCITTQQFLPKLTLLALIKAQTGLWHSERSVPNDSYDRETLTGFQTTHCVSESRRCTNADRRGGTNATLSLLRAEGVSGASSSEVCAYTDGGWTRPALGRSHDDPRPPKPGEHRVRLMFVQKQRSSPGTHSPTGGGLHRHL